MKLLGFLLAALFLFCGPAFGQATSESSRPTESTISKDRLFARGFSFDEHERAMCKISGPEGPCRVQAFVRDEKRVDPDAYTCSKLDRAMYRGACVGGKLQGLSVVVADGSTKGSREAFVSYFHEGRMAYPALTSYLDGEEKNLGVDEKTKSYGCVYFGNWDKSRERCGRFIEMYGTDIFTESNAQRLKDGTFDLDHYRVNFLEFLGKDVVGTAALKQIPEATFALRDKTEAEPTSTVVLGPPHSDDRGRPTGTVAVYGGPSSAQIFSIAMDAAGKLLAAGGTAGRVDLWDPENRRLIRSFQAGSHVTLSKDGKTLVTGGESIQIWDVASGELKRRIPWDGDDIWQLSLDPSETRLLVSANRQDDCVFDLSTGQKIATLARTRYGQFSRDGALIVGGNKEHLNVWNTNTWEQVKDFPNTEAVWQLAAIPEKNLAILGGLKTTRLVRLDTGGEVAKLGDGRANFVAFHPNGSVFFTYAGNGFIVWDMTGKPLCTRRHLGNGHTALSGNGRWLAAAQVGARELFVWDVDQVLRECGVN